MQDLLNLVSQWEILIYALGFLLVTVECAGLPIPALVYVVLAAALAGQGRLSFVIVFAITVGGGVVGGIIGYYIGKRGGRPLLERYGRYVKLTPTRLLAAESYYRQQEVKVLILGRYMPIFCFSAGILSGVMRVPMRRFLICNLLGITLWSSTHLTLALLFGQNLDELLGYFNLFGLTVLVILISLGLFLYLRRQKTLSRGKDR
jgi:membrane protein DedA with SNARE-associated domain